MAILDNLFEYLLKGGSLVGVGGGVAAGKVYFRFVELEKKATSALKLATDAKQFAFEAKTALQIEFAAGIADAKAYVDTQLGKIARGSIVELQSDQATNERLAKLETRMSSMEDDLDARDTEDRRWQQEIQRALGRIEGRLETIP